MTNIDPIEIAIGRFGRFPKLILFLLSLGRLPAEFQLINVVFLLPEVNYVCLDALASNSTNYCPCENPQYDQATIVSSVTSTWNLICDRRSLASLAQSMLQVGVLVGSLIYGFISDRFGRKIAVTLALALEAITVALSALVSEFWMFLVCRFLIGTGVGGTLLCVYVLLIELSGKSFRTYLTGLQEIAYIVSYIFMPVIAYFVRDWRQLQLVTSVPWIFVLAYFWILPESPRWLITVGKKDEAIRVVTQIAKRNNMPTDNIPQIVNEIEKESIGSKDQGHGTYLDLFKTPRIRGYIVIMALVWLCCAHTFFGVNQYIGLLQGNLYLNVLLSAAFQAPGLALCVLSTVLLPRKASVIISFSVAALSLIVIIFIPSTEKIATLSFAILGQTGIYSAFVLIYLHSSEIFPTVVRNSAMGFASVFARFGAFIAPFVVNIGVQWISLSIFSALALSAAVLCYFLPETKGVVLLNSIQQAEQDVAYDFEDRINNVQKVTPSELVS